MRNLVCCMLVHGGYGVLEARDGSQALRICETHRHPIELALTDLMLPKMRGTELADRLRRVRPDLRILLMSGYANEPVVHRLGRDSMVLLLKPFTSVELVKRVRQVLDAPWEGITTRLNA